MKSHLDRDSDWADWGAKAGYKASALAKLRNVSLRQLERYFIDYYGRPPQEWLNELRMAKSAVLLVDGHRVKEVALRLGFDSASNFSRKFARFYGCRPSKLIQIHDHRRDKRKRQFESWFPGEEVPSEWLADPTLAKHWEALLQQSRRIRLGSVANP